MKTVCAKHNISDATYYAWKRKYGGMDVSEARRLRSLEEENGRLKRLVADQAVQIQVLKEVNSKKWYARHPRGGPSMSALKGTGETHISSTERHDCHNGVDTVFCLSCC